jgi:hypothetical protein
MDEGFVVLPYLMRLSDDILGEMEFWGWVFC